MIDYMSQSKVISYRQDTQVDQMFLKFKNFKSNVCFDDIFQIAIGEKDISNFPEFSIKLAV